MTDDQYPTEAIVNGLMMTGTRPAAEAIAKAPLLEDWCYTITETSGVLKFHGRIHGHPRLPEGDLMTSSRVRYVDPRFEYVVTSNRVCRLGDRRAQE